MDYEHLSDEQKYAFLRVKNGDNLFITGAGGTGKTQLIRVLVAQSIKTGKNIQVCALTGCASVLLNCGARTIHSWSGIRLAKGEKRAIIASVLQNKRATANWKKIDILIIDEVSMMSKKVFDVLEETARAVRRNTGYFGGIQVILTGDFFQLPPVGNKEEPDTENFCFESAKWGAIFPPANCIELKTVFRQKDPIYRNILEQVRRGTIDADNIRILQDCVGKSVPSEHMIPTKLFPIRVKTDFVNTSMFLKLSETEHKFDYTSSTNNVIYHNEGSSNLKPIPAEMLIVCAKLTKAETDYEIQNLVQNTNCIQVLRLKKGASVMCTANIDMDNGICNGSQGVIIDFVKNPLNVEEPVVRFSNGQTRCIHPHIYQSEEYHTITISQYPICLAWAMTIHKIQGATLSTAEIDVGSSIFEYGQSYVALSRVESLTGLYLSTFHPQKIRANPIVVAFYEQFSMRDYTQELSDLENCMDPLLETFESEKAPLSDIKIIKLSR
jgi:ATP-dependent DNA helicase PIF1